MSNLHKFQETSFDAEVLGSELPVLVDFYADWCSPCLAMAPIIEKIAEEYSTTITVGKLDVDNAQDIAIRYSVMNIPMLGLFKGGQLVDRLVGYHAPSGVRSWLERSMEPTTTTTT